jgi:hypothetical protein
MIPYIIASYPRSGNTWIRYIIEWFSGQPTLGINWRKGKPWPIHPTDRPICERINGFKTNGDSPIAEKKHFVFHLKKPEDFQKDVVLVIRNYKEAIIRHNPKTLNNNELFKKQIYPYMEMIRAYDDFFLGRQHIVYYEDLISSPVKVIPDLLKFMRIYDDKEFGKFIDIFQTHKKQSINLYSSEINPSITKGNKSIHHSKKLSGSQSKEWDNFIKQKWPSLLDKYLKRYIL